MAFTKSIKMSEKSFFEQQTPSSRIKASIVSEYFPSYSQIIAKANKPKVIRYIDLFAGPGIYEDGNYSTPMLIGQKCQKESFLKENVQFLFNDKEYKTTLEKNFTDEFPIGTFTIKPRFGNLVIGQDEKIREWLMRGTHEDGKNAYPSLLFIDPFGYKGIETEVLAKFMENWGNEIFLFVNTKRIHPALENDKFDGLMKTLFPSTLDKVRSDRRYKLSVPERLNLIIQSLGQEYENILKSKVYHSAFKFQEEDSDATSHYILHLTKHHRGFDLVKQIYSDFANVGTVFDGNNTYTFDAKQLDEANMLFDERTINIDLLKEGIYGTFKGQELSALDLFDDHHKTNLNSRRHYSEALRSLAADGKLTSRYLDTVNHNVSVLLSKDCILKFN
jgi:three-Cys-motif partner protein